MTVMRFVDLRHLHKKPHFFCYRVAGWVYKSCWRQIVLYSRYPFTFNSLLLFVFCQISKYFKDLVLE